MDRTEAIALQRRFHQVADLARRFDARVARVDDAEHDRLLHRAEAVDRLRGILAAAHIDTELRDGERRELLDDLLGREEVRIQGERDAGPSETVERRTREVDELGVRGERRLLDVDERRARGLESAQLVSERVGDRERARGQMPAPASARRSRWAP